MHFVMAEILAYLAYHEVRRQAERARRRVRLVGGPGLPAHREGAVTGLPYDDTPCLTAEAPARRPVK